MLPIGWEGFLSGKLFLSANKIGDASTV